MSPLAASMHMLIPAGLVPAPLLLAAALLLGIAVGLERQLRHHVAGVHTNALVALGSATYVIVQMAAQDPSPTRIAAQVSSGIGFLCAGAILRDGLNIRGLNTAATLWCTAAVGVLCGSDLLELALLVTLFVLATNIVLHWAERKVFTLNGKPEPEQTP